MSCEDEVMRITRKLEKISKGEKSMDEAMPLLQILAKLPITIEVLTKTRVGMTINELRKKTTDDRVSKRAKSLIKEWKNLLEKKNSRIDSMVLPRNDSSASNLSDNNINDAPKQTSFPTKPISADEIRTKSTEMLDAALRCGDMPVGTLDTDVLAARIENKLYEFYKGTGDNRVFNLRDKKNPALRENVLTGVVVPERFAVMTSEEMASAEIKQIRERFTKQAIDEHQMSVVEGTPSDMFKCGKCRGKNCTYNQMQTRSADEPMTTFVYCRDCGNRWKFS